MFQSLGFDYYDEIYQNSLSAPEEPDEPIIDADEMGFQVLLTSIKTWAIKNTKNISINVADSDKEHLSIMASITSDNQKLPLFIIGKGNNIETVEEELGPMIDDNECTFWGNAYMNSECFCQYLEFLPNQYPNNQTLHLIIDKYSSHTSNVSIEKAESLNIKLYFIPSHYTGINLPLNIPIVAPLKSKANKEENSKVTYGPANIGNWNEKITIFFTRITEGIAKIHSYKRMRLISLSNLHFFMATLHSIFFRIPFTHFNYISCFFIFIYQIFSLFIQF